MSTPSKLGIFFSKPLNQALLVVVLTGVLTLFDYLLPHDEILLDADAGPWISSTAMILLFILINTIVALRIEVVLPYWTSSIVLYLLLLGFAYGWSFVLTGKHIDDVGSFRWIWMVLTMVYLVFFVISRSMKRIVDLAIKQDKKLRGEE